MRRTVYRGFWVWNFDQEEKWLNEMASKGLQLVSVGWCRYVFEEGDPGEYTYRLELLENLPTHAESLQYIRFLEDTGAKYIGNVLRWSYFKKKVTDGAFDLFSDIDSRIKHLNRISLLILPFFIMDLAFGLSNLSLFFSRRILGGNLEIGISCLMLGLLMGFGFFKTCSKAKKLKKERILYE